jgi:TolB protein
MRNRLLVLVILGLSAACSSADRQAEAVGAEAPALSTAGASEGAIPYPADPAERRLGNMMRLTHGGSNSEAYFSADATELIFQATRPGDSDCDQIYTIGLDGRNLRKVSTGEGRTTCGYFFPGRDRIIYSSTHHVDAQCPTPPDRSQGYVWGLFPYDVFSARPDGSDLRNLTNHDGYDAEATISPDGSRIVFTSLRDNDLNIFVMDADGGNLRQLTDEIGYDGGAFFSADGSRIVYRAHHPTDPNEIREYQELLGRQLIRPERVEIFVMDADGSNKRQITSNGAANFAPFFHPDGRRIIFSSNLHNPAGRGFSLYLVDTETREIERVTHTEGFDSFPMFSPDGSKLVFASDRGARDRTEFNLFVAEWVD